jgi:hypothetical protein
MAGSARLLLVWLPMLPRPALDQVVGEYAVFGSDSRTVDASEFGAAPAVAAFDLVDPAFGTDAPLNHLAERAQLGSRCAPQEGSSDRGLRAIRRTVDHHSWTLSRGQGVSRWLGRAPGRCVSHASSAVRGVIDGRLAAADERFRGSTTVDVDGRLGRYCRIKRDDQQLRDLLECVWPAVLDGAGSPFRAASWRASLHL